jgi:hypothetical protein
MRFVITAIFLFSAGMSVRAQDTTRPNPADAATNGLRAPIGNASKDALPAPSTSAGEEVQGLEQAQDANELIATRTADGHIVIRHQDDPVPEAEEAR